MKYLITIPVTTDADPSALLDKALEFGESVSNELGEDVTQDEDATAVEEV